MTVLFVVVLVFFVWHKVRRRRRLSKAAASPLAGLDTGTRSPYRTPKSTRFHGGF